MTAACVEAFKLIEMETHDGVHPCMGAVDLVPIYPLFGVGVGECARVARSRSLFFLLVTVATECLARHVKTIALSQDPRLLVL